MTRKSQKAQLAQSRKKKNRSEKRSRHLGRNVLNNSSPISRLPNELVQSILSRLDIHELIHLQVVNKKWQAVICSIGQSKKSLWLAQFSHHSSDFLKIRSFGHIDLSTFTNIKFKPNSSEHSHSQLVKFFPNIESIVMDLHLADILTLLHQLPLNQLIILSVSDTLVRGGQPASSDDLQQLLIRINLCVSLKRLNIEIQINSQMSILETILPQLEQFSCRGYEPTIVGHFGPNCSRVSLATFWKYANFYQWHTINGQWLANLTHLELETVSELDRVIHYLSEHALALQGLRIFSQSTRMSTQMIGHLFSLKHLSDIYLNWIIFDLPQLDQARRNFQLIPLVSIRTCNLTIFKFINFTDTKTNNMKSSLFASILSTILPNVEQLNITIDHFSYGTLQRVDSYLKRFTKLKKHSFKKLPY